MKKKVVLQLEEDDIKWLKEVYGDGWKHRMEQHIANEVYIRRKDADRGLKMRAPWDY